MVTYVKRAGYKISYRKSGLRAGRIRKKAVNLYKCHCGHLFETMEDSVRYGFTNSCGCLRRMTTAVNALQHRIKVIQAMGPSIAGE